jgi:hypothetical protein
MLWQHCQTALTLNDRSLPDRDDLLAIKTAIAHVAQDSVSE